MPFIICFNSENAQAPGFIQIPIHVMAMIGIFQNLKNIILNAKKNCAQMVMGLLNLTEKNIVLEKQPLMGNIHNFVLWVQKDIAEEVYQMENCIQQLQVYQNGVQSALMITLTTSPGGLYFREPKPESKRILTSMLMTCMKMNMET